MSPSPPRVRPCDPPRPSKARAIALACLALAAPACGGPGEGRVAVHPASGRVTYQGQPLPGALVVFRKPEGDPGIPSPVATTGDDGSFRLRTYEPDDGAPEGDYLVAISIAPPPRDGAGILDQKARPRDDVLKGRFADPKASGLKATIKPGPNELGPFDLKASGGAAPVGPDARWR